jgi:hypothetical protein
MKVVRDLTPTPPAPAETAEVNGKIAGLEISHPKQGSKVLIKTANFAGLFRGRRTIRAGFCLLAPPRR